MLYLNVSSTVTRKIDTQFLYIYIYIYNELLKTTHSMVKLENNNGKSSISFSELPHFIAKPPSAVMVKEKQTVTLPCKAAGFPHPVITWYQNGNQIGEKRKQFNKKDLEIEDIQFADRGIYTCTAENLLGRVELSVNVTVEGTY